MELTGKKFNRLTAIKPVWINKQKRWECICECGTIKSILTTDLKSGKVKSCGCLRNELLSKRMSGESHYAWKGGKPIINGKGYMEYRYGELRGIKVHRHLYENHYGIKLLPHQNIHHINGDRTDNRIENLELWDSSQPSGQRVEDKIEYYFKLIGDYKDHPKYKELISKTRPLVLN